MHAGERVVPVKAGQKQDRKGEQQLVHPIQPDDTLRLFEMNTCSWERKEHK